MMKSFELDGFYKDLDNIENQYLNLIYDPIFDRVVERWIYEKTSGLMEWKCAICGCDILVDKNKNDVENFVCDGCKKIHNNTNEIIDRRIVDSRTKMYEWIKDRIYDELEDNLKGGK